ncbi:CfaE/CblD family pilus tip adhesin, partial [Escherichia coli]|uniref:CfaE/CblD family pilus tip adhesin n=1 Tax=Escherichia coli TaxID=562 RepID=UPI003F6647E2
MRNRLIAMILCLFDMAASVQAAPNVTAEVTYDLASGRANYYFWNREDPPAVNYNTTWANYKCDFPENQQSCTSNGNSSSVVVYLTEKRSGMRWPVKLIGYINAEVWQDGPCKGWSKQLALNNGSGYYCMGDDHVQYLAQAKPVTLYLEQAEMKKLPIGGIWECSVKLRFTTPGTDYTANITLNVLDPNHIDIFFPEFAHATPRVQLDLHPTGSVNGSNYAQDLTMLDMCRPG